MAILANRIKVKNNLIELSKFSIYSTKRFVAIILLAFSFYLLYFSTPKAMSSAILESVGRILSAGTLIYDETINSFHWLERRLSYFKDLEAENLRLKLRLSQMQKTMRAASDLQAENRALKKLLNVTDNVNKAFITAKIVALSASPFSSSAMFQSGSNQGVKVNDVVLGNAGLIGRISEVSENYSSAVLIDDHDSRIPVITGKSRIRGIVARQDDNLKIIYLEPGHDISIGEIVYTSGDGKIFPRGMPVATIVETTDNSAIIEPIERLNKLEYVIIESNS